MWTRWPANELRPVTGRAVEIKDYHQVRPVEVLAQELFQTVAAIGQADPDLGLLHANLGRLATQQRTQRRQTIQSRRVACLHGGGDLPGGHSHSGCGLYTPATYAMLPSARTLLRRAGRINGDAGHELALDIGVPRPYGRRGEQSALLQVVGQTLPHLLSRAFDGGLGQPHASHLLEQVDSLLEITSDRAGQRGQLFDYGRQAAAADAGLLIERIKPLAAVLTVVAGPHVEDGATQALHRAVVVGVIANRTGAVATAHAGSAVADFFWASRCS